MYKSAHSSMVGHDGRRGPYTPRGPYAPRRRGSSSSKKKIRMGRRTKLTDDLLQSISEIAAVTEILSISHLSKELEGRGYSLSRSTVFRAMESLGLKADRDKKMWCVGQAKTDRDGQPTATSTTDDAADSKTDAQSATDEQHQSSLVNANSFCVTAQDNRTYLYSLEPPWILEYPPSKLDLAHEQLANGDGELETTMEPSRKPVVTGAHPAGTASWQATDEFGSLASYPTSQEGSTTITIGRREGHDILPARATFTPLMLPNSHASASKLEKVGLEINGDQTDPQGQEVDSVPQTCAQSSSILTGAWAEGRAGLGRGEELNFELRRGRKRKSCFPAKVAKSTEPPQSNSDRQWIANGSDKFHHRPPTLQDGDGRETPGGLKEANGPVPIGNTLGLVAVTGIRTPQQILKVMGVTSEVSQEDSGSKTAKRRKGDSELKSVVSEQAYRIAAQTREVNGVPHHVSERGGAGPHPSDGRPMNHFTEQPPDQNRRERLRRERGNPQRARLHALTSNLAAKTWANAREMSVKRSNMDRELTGKQVSMSPEVVRFHLPTSRAPVADQSAEYRMTAAARTKSDDQRRDSTASPAATTINGPQQPSRSLFSHDVSNGDVDDGHPESPTDSSVGPLQVQELRQWMQGVYQKLTSMDQQLQYLTQVVVSLASATDTNRSDGQEQQTGATSAAVSEADDEQGEREGGDSQLDGKEAAEGEANGEVEEKGHAETSATWGNNLPPVNTPQSDDLIRRVLEDAPWDTLSPFIGGPRMAIRLARDCIFGQEVLSRSTVTGRNGMNPLQRDGIKKIQDCLMEVYGEDCSDVERELLWKMTRESLSQLCKRTRRQLAAEDNDPETDSQEDTP